MITPRLLLHELSHCLAALRVGARSATIQIQGPGWCRTFPDWGDDIEPTSWQDLCVTLAGPLLVPVHDNSKDLAEIAAYPVEERRRAMRWLTFVVAPEIKAITPFTLGDMLRTIEQDGALLIEPEAMH